MSESDGSSLLEEEGYYGKNDARPYPCCKRVCIYTLLIVLSPLILLVFLLALPFLCYAVHTGKVSEHQICSGKQLFFDYGYKAPGKKLHLKARSEEATDILIRYEFVDYNHRLHTCGGLGFSLRKSIEHTVDDHIRNGPHGAKVECDTDVEKPRYHLNGSTYPYDPSYDELWTSAGRGCLWGSIYSWSPRLPEGLSWSALTQTIDLETAPEVFGHIFFFEVSNPKFYETDRIERVSQVVNCPKITPDNEGKLFVRYDYGSAYDLGNLPAGVPDAYIFKGKALKEAHMKLLHTYRIMKPMTRSEASESE